MRLRIGAFGVVVLLLTALVWAQAGGIAGVVRDSSGGVLPGVTVEVTSPALIEKARSTTTDVNGRYQIRDLPAGTYTVTFTLTGFQTYQRPNVVVAADFTANVNAEMKVGSVTETLSVVAEAPVVDAQNARVQQVFQGSEVTSLSGRLGESQQGRVLVDGMVIDADGLHVDCRTQRS